MGSLVLTALADLGQKGCRLAIGSATLWLIHVFQYTRIAILQPGVRVINWAINGSLFKRNIN